MKKLTIIILLTAIQIFSIVFEIKAQNPNDFYNSLIPYSNFYNTCVDPFRGYFKPNTTEWNGPNPSDSEAYFPVLVVFVQFADDPVYAPFGSWPIGEAPVYINTMIATEKNKNQNIPWWEKYNSETEALSSQWMEISRGKLHVISPFIKIVGNDTLIKGAFSVVLDSAYKYTTEQQMNQAIWMDLHRQGLTDWTPYDKWRYNNQDGRFYYEKDSIVDFIYKIHRSRGRGPMPSYDGFSALTSSGSGSCLVDTVHSIIADYSWGINGSGFTVSFRGLKSQYIGCTGHEHGHYMMMPGHIQNSRVSYGIGFDGFFSPYDMILNGYMTPRTATFGTSNSLGDYSSRNNNAEGEILKVPIDNNTDECFLIANRRKISKWDRIMLGDTAQIDPYNDYTDYGKGIYIYHIKNGVHFPQTTNDTVQDLECADGYWEWELKSTLGIAKVPFDCFVSNPGWKVYQKKNVLYTNDPSTLGQAYGQGNLGNPNPWGDGVSFFYRYNDNPQVSQWSVGDETTTPCMLGTDRIYTNEEEYYFSYERAGDRWDAWNVGYNEIFSPYSSPNTFSWNNDTTGIFIWYNNLNGNTASIIVERAEEYGGNKPLSEILEETPPSRPMGVKIDITDCIDGKIFPVIIWNHNMEPDMTHYLGENEYKTYKIYRAFTDINNVPGNYEEIATVNIHPNDIPTYIDYNTYVQCDEGVGSFNVRVRYRVQAVDIFNDLSVLSDFVSISTYLLQKGEGDGGDAIHGNLTYKLEQNYPNPFNPVTNIQYSISKEGFVSLKVYDVLGREVKSLVNEFKQAGSYIVSFDGSELSSGIYFYRLEAGDFVQVKRMILIK